MWQHGRHVIACISEIIVRGVVEWERGGDVVPHFFVLKFLQKLVHCCNWLLTETQCKIISVQHVCRPELFKNLCLSLVSGALHFFSWTIRLVIVRRADLVQIPKILGSSGVDFYDPMPSLQYVFLRSQLQHLYQSMAGHKCKG